MPKYETNVQLPPVPAVQKPGPERYALPSRVAGQVQDKLRDGTDVEASWHDGAILSVTIVPHAEPADQHAQVALRALQDVVGPDAVVPPFHKVEDGAAS